MMFRSNGAAGQFQIRPGGIHPEAGQSYQYSDGQYDFWFYVHFKAPPDVEKPTVFIENATTDRFSGGKPAIRRSDRVAIKGNIRGYFKQFDILDRPISPTNPAPSIKFVWRLAP